MNRMIAKIGGRDSENYHLDTALRAFGLARQFDEFCARYATPEIQKEVPADAGGAGDATGAAPEVAASDDDDGGDGDGDPDRRPLHRTSTTPPALFALAPLSQYVGFGRSRIYQLVADPRLKFPPPLKIGKSVRWLKSEVDAWVMTQAAARTTTSTAG